MHAKQAVQYQIQLLILTFDDNSGIASNTWDDGSEGYFAYYLDEDYESNGLVVEVGTFLNDGDYVTQFCVYVEEE